MSLDKGVKYSVLKYSIVILFLVISIQIVDPFHAVRDTPPITENDDPEKVLLNVLNRTATTSHTETITLFSHDEHPFVATKMVQQVEYDPEDGQYLESDGRAVTSNRTNADTPNDLPPISYSSESMGWVHSPHHGWVMAPRYHYAERTLVRTQVVQESNLTVLSRSDSELVMRLKGANASILNTAPLTLGSHSSMNITITIDREEQVLRELEGAHVREADYRYRFHSYGTTDVERPDGVPPVSVRGLLWDVTHGPLFSL